jgi:CRP/FNR family transcriptional regulator, cyclic AMP receptor protein
MDVPTSPLVDSFFEQYRLRHYSKGQILILSGDDTEYVYYLISGRVKQYDVTYRGDEIILNVFTPPSFFPMSLAMNHAPNPYTYEAETDIELKQAPSSEVIEFVKHSPEVLYDLLSRVYTGTDGLLARMTHLMASSAKARLMFEILIAQKRFGEQNGDQRYDIPINEVELAARAGLSRETVSREMGKLIKENLVTHQPGVVSITNLSAFEDKLGKVL